MMRVDLLVPLNRQIVKDIKRELRLQGHYDTGNLENSMDPRESVENGTLIIEAFAAEYIQELEHGVPAGQINITPEEFANLVAWVRRKITGSFTPPETIAGLIVQKWREQGKPLSTSVEFSKTGRITGAIAETFSNNENEYFKQMDYAIETELDLKTFRKSIEII